MPPATGMGVNSNSIASAAAVAPSSYGVGGSAYDENIIYLSVSDRFKLFWICYMKTLQLKVEAFVDI